MTQPSSLLKHRPALCNIVRRLAVEAGELILDYAQGVKTLTYNEKTDGSPVTSADQHAERLIEEKLVETLPNIPVIGEESHAQGRRINTEQEEYFWLIDPLDGTRAFMRGEKDYTVNIALIHHGKPVIGVIYAPEFGELYSGYHDINGNMQAFRYFEDSDKEKTLKTRSMPKEGITIVQSHAYKLGHHPFIEQFKINKVLRRPSSLKISMIANRKADLYARLGQTCEWDTAAGHAILKAAGGDIVDLNGCSLEYGKNTETHNNPEFIAATHDVLSCLSFPIQAGHINL
ncbi:MAG: 3'(2'),5'-bisphosphate nucleotidase CysQ [Alphaproteobacteria bacterium]|nr:3'(2'),5'-bisphosphate nucleotidase CysQ [Alphaproteobacteria bacterium]